MTGFPLFPTLACTCTLLPAARRRACRPSDHLVCVVGRHRVRDGLSKRYWIRCRRCDLERGPYDDWQAAWLDAWRTQIALRRRAGGRSRSPRPASSRAGA
ncbi:MAG TPA: hypothetical protein VK631_15755 [Solirubrobacteraceae bacterium]|nr:hypothetical protein [Solirubrobacteraceae bacterium]